MPQPAMAAISTRESEGSSDVAIRPRHGWASEDDWAFHRETITALYWDENRPLKDVIVVMRQTHDFRAT